MHPTQAGAFPDLEVPLPDSPPPRHGTPFNIPEEPKYSPSIEELQRYHELKAKAYSSGMTMRRFLMQKEFGALPEPLRQQLFRDLVMMAMRGELDRQQFLEEPPPQ
jgi:hypothetical protein